MGTVEFLGKAYLLNVLDSIEKRAIKCSIVGKISLEQILKNFIHQVESIFPTLVFSILRIRENRLFNLVSPSLPIILINGFAGIPIGPEVGSCGTAAYFGKKVISPSILSDPKWKNFYNLIRETKIRACISIPILNNKGQAVFTLAIYLKEERSPGKLEDYLIERSGRLLSLLLLKSEYLESLEKANERYEFVNKATQDAIYDWDLSSDKIHFGPAFFKLFGFKTHKEQFSRADFVSLIYEKDISKYKESLLAFLNSKKNQWKIKVRMRKENGSYAFIDEVAYVLRDENGNPFRWIGVLRDLTYERKIELQKKVQLQISGFFRNRKKNLKDILIETSEYLAKLGQFDLAEIWLTDLEKKKINMVSFFF